MDIDVAHNPFELVTKLQDERLAATGSEGLFGRTSEWYHNIARALAQLDGRYKIEACVGDFANVLEQIRYGVVGHRQSRESEQQATTGVEQDDPGIHVDANKASPSDLGLYPLTYDRIHLSNIPDYVGGNLTSFMYALPITNTGDASFFTSCCLRNPPRFKTPHHFNNEYVAICAPSDLRKLFHVEMEALDFPEDSPLIMTEYLRWHRCETSSSFEDLMPRQALETWLHRLFLKLAIPKERRARDFTLIYSPLNLTAFIRLCYQLQNVGYPAHWVSGVLDDILSGSVNIKARPPRSEPLAMKEVKNEANMRAMPQSTAPFVAELSTLASMWQCVLPFGILSSAVPEATSVHKYSIEFEEVPDLVAETPSFVLLLFDAGLLPPGTESLRQFILSDEKADRSPRAKPIRERGLHLLTTWSWHRASKTATFWLRKDVLESLRTKDRAISVWRTDNWMFQGMPMRVRTDVKDHGSWI